MLTHGCDWLEYKIFCVSHEERSFQNFMADFIGAWGQKLFQFIPAVLFLTILATAHDGAVTSKVCALCHLVFFIAIITCLSPCLLLLKTCSELFDCPDKHWTRPVHVREGSQKKYFFVVFDHTGGGQPKPNSYCKIYFLWNLLLFSLKLAVKLVVKKHVLKIY